MLREWYDICSCKKKGRQAGLCPEENQFVLERLLHLITDHLAVTECGMKHPTAPVGLHGRPSVQTVVVLGSDQILLCIIPFYIHWVQHRSVQVQISTGVVSEGGQPPAPRQQDFCVGRAGRFYFSNFSSLLLFFFLQVFMFLFTILIRVVQ